jgi:hypothetical protein
VSVKPKLCLEVILLIKIECACVREAKIVFGSDTVNQD